MDWRDLPPLAALRAFAAYAETRSVEEAGAALNVSHAAISQQLRKLEEHMGVALLDRSGRQLALTAEGAELALALGEGFEAIGRGVAALTQREDDRPLQITSTAMFAAVWLVPRLPRFRHAYPEIDLMVDPSVTLRPLEPGGVDAALRHGDGNWPGLDAELIVDSPIAIVAAPDLVGEAEIGGPEELRRMPWLQELGTNEASAWLKSYGGDGVLAGGVTSLPGNLVLEAARQGQGVAITTRIAVTEDVAAGRLRLLFEEDTHKGYYLVTRPGVHRAALRAFVRWIRAEAARAG
ncbi:LysR family transcriptional regulator [Marinibacterium profundimaris]|uniref:LysR family transcriptional regulator n=1 Tax=Marinibacterium profundimaris TaxID=1679460 RepID=A0A225NIQ1_9RHOB|nr:LysR family transcriptional regulator [Marinibacterium profundimaris]OWU73480.1 LysR family transcriptional regulator [Marinibacterium profundimaris]